ncbi:MAG: hypothetical protein ACBR12_26560 [Microcoleus sp.]
MVAQYWLVLPRKKEEGRGKKEEGRSHPPQPPPRGEIQEEGRRKREEDLTAEGAEGAEGGGKEGRLPRIAIRFVLRVLVFCTVEF